MNKKSIFLLSALLIAANATVMANGKADNSASGTGKPAEIIVGAGSTYNPYWFLDANNNLTGFEKAVLDEIDRRHPEFTLKYQVYDFANILLSLESGKIDIAAHQFEYNIERNQKFLYGSEGYTTFPLYLAVREDDDSIKSFEDLTGKTVVSPSTTDNAFYITNKYNEDHGKPFKIIFEATRTLSLEDITAHRADAMIDMIRNIEVYNREYNAHLKAVGEPVQNSNAYYLFNKQNGAQLKATFDAEIKKLKEDGTLLKLSQQWLGGDFIAKD
jgi:ABC-type amino acid transport substrate-binding protein